MRLHRNASAFLAVLSTALQANALRADDGLGIPDEPVAVKKKGVAPRVLPPDAGAAQQAARDRWKPWEQEDRPGPMRLPEPQTPSSVITPSSARQATPRVDPSPQSVPMVHGDEKLNKTLGPMPPFPTPSRLPLDDSLLTPPTHPPTPTLEVFPAPARVDDCRLELPLAPPMLGDAVSPFLAANNPRFRRAFVHQLGASRFKVGDNNSPMPDQRGLSSFNAFHDPFKQGGRLYKGTSGFEFAGWNRRASIDVRGGLGVYTSDHDDIVVFAMNPSTTVKVVFMEGPSFKASGGLGVSFPNGDAPDGADETDFIFAPFVGWLWSSPGSSWFLHGFEQVDVPWNDDPVRLQSDVGVGYWIRRDDPTKMITAIAPTFELHLYTPFGDAPGGDREGLPSDHVLNATLGATMYFGPTDSLAFGVGAPLFGPRHYEWEGHLHFVHRF